MSAQALRAGPLRGMTTVPCDHHGFHSATTRYHRRAGVLRFVLVCDRCGTEIREVTRIAYRPHFDSHRSPPLAA